MTNLSDVMLMTDEEMREHYRDVIKKEREMNDVLERMRWNRMLCEAEDKKIRRG